LFFVKLKMVHSLLIVHGNSQKRYEKGLQLAENFLAGSLINHPDFFLLEDPKSIKIDHIRQLQHQLALRPYSALLKVALINEADKLTLPAQHALLKTLEEPPEASVIILTTPHKEVLLPTIVSRCQIISLPNEKTIMNESSFTEQLSTLNAVLSATPGQRLLIAEKVAINRDQTMEFCQNQLELWSLLMQQKAGILKTTKKTVMELSWLEIVGIIKQIQLSLHFLKQNVNPQLVVGNVLLSYPF